MPENRPRYLLHDFIFAAASETGIRLFWEDAQALGDNIFKKRVTEEWGVRNPDGRIFEMPDEIVARETALGFPQHHVVRRAIIMDWTVDDDK